MLENLLYVPQSFRPSAVFQMRFNSFFVRLLLTFHILFTFLISSSGGIKMNSPPFSDDEDDEDDDDDVEVESV